MYNPNRYGTPPRAAAGVQRDVIVGWLSCTIETGRTRRWLVEQLLDTHTRYVANKCFERLYRQLTCLSNRQPIYVCGHLDRIEIERNADFDEWLMCSRWWGVRSRDIWCGRRRISWWFGSGMRCWAGWQGGSRRRRVSNNNHEVSANIRAFASGGKYENGGIT